MREPQHPARGRLDRHAHTRAAGEEHTALSTFTLTVFLALALSLTLTFTPELQASGTPLSDIAVLYRTHAVGHNVYKALKEAGISRQASSADVFDRPDVVPILSVLRLLTNPGDDAAFRLIATGTLPPFSGLLMDQLTTEATRTKSSLFAAAKALHQSSGVLASGGRATPSPSPSAFGTSMGGSMAWRSSTATVSLDVPSRKTVHTFLRKMDDLVRSARTETPEMLLKVGVRVRIEMRLQLGLHVF